MHQGCPVTDTAPPSHQMPAEFPIMALPTQAPTVGFCQKEGLGELGFWVDMAQPLVQKPLTGTLNFQDHHEPETRLLICAYRQWICRHIPKLY